MSLLTRLFTNRHVKATIVASSGDGGHPLELQMDLPFLPCRGTILHMNFNRYLSVTQTLWDLTYPTKVYVHCSWEDDHPGPTRKEMLARGWRFEGA